MHIQLLARMAKTRTAQSPDKLRADRRTSTRALIHKRKSSTAIKVSPSNEGDLQVGTEL